MASRDRKIRRDKKRYGFLATAPPNELRRYRMLTSRLVWRGGGGGMTATILRGIFLCLFIMFIWVYAVCFKVH